MHASSGALLAAEYDVSTVPEQIYARVFQSLKPGAAVPDIRVEFRKYANAKAQIQLRDGVLTVKIADTLAVAPDEVQTALAEILLSKLFRRRVPAESQTRYRKYLNRREVRADLEQTRRARGRKQLAEPEGEHHNLLQIFDELNFAYFFGLMARPTIGWSRKASRTMLGHYDPSHHTIVLSKILDRADVPKLAVEYVMYHEMLHLRHPVEHRGTRRCVHTADFKAEEKRFAQFAEAKKLLKILV
jgi:hypothetical protein